MRRVVVTGIGLVTPLGAGVLNVWNRLINGESGLQPITICDASDLACQVAGQVPRTEEANALSQGKVNYDEWIEPKERRKMGDYSALGIIAADIALKDAGWMPQDEESKLRTGVMIGAGIGGLEGIYETSVTLFEKGPRRVSPFFIPSCLINLVSGHVSIRHGFKGPNHSVVTACSTGAHAIGDAARLIQYGDADVMVAGGAEAAVCRLGIAGFASARALATKFNDRPTEASRPWDQDRDGFVMGEGAGILVLEELEHAKKRGAHIYGEVIGYGLSGDAYHVTAPAEDGDGAYRAMQAALKRAQVKPEDVDYINAHGTSTPLGDLAELRATKRLFGDAMKTVSISSTKSAIGHLLGAAGSVEAIFSLLAIEHGILPPTLNLVNPDEEAKGVDLVPLHAKEKNVNVALSNSFGFGGTNASLVFKKFTA
jgi:3-oxoacyl-[acyl-carrier-protein] synthase II